MNFDQSIEQKNSKYPKEKFEGIDGEIYLSNPRTTYYNEMAKIIFNSIPKVTEGCVRLWRGSRKDEVNENTIVTNSLIGIALPFMYAYKGLITYVDVPTLEYMNYVQISGVALNSEFKLPDSFKGKFKIVNPEIYKNFEQENPDEMLYSK